MICMTLRHGQSNRPACTQRSIFHYINDLHSQEIVLKVGLNDLCHVTQRNDYPIKAIPCQIAEQDFQKWLAGYWCHWFRKVRNYRAKTSALSASKHYCLQHQAGSPKMDCSIRPHRIWPTTRCPSCILGVSLDGTAKMMLQRSRMCPPRLPVMPIATIPFARASDNAARILGDLPEVEYAISTSCLWPSA